MRFAACLAIIVCMACASAPALDWNLLFEQGRVISERGTSLQVETIDLRIRFADSIACREDSLIMVDVGQVLGEIVTLRRIILYAYETGEFTQDDQGYQFLEDYLVMTEQLLDSHEEFLTTMEQIGRKKGCFE